MSIVNWEGSAIFGPGSEWFWSMASFVVVVVSLAGIYRQLRAQGAANAVQRIESLQGKYESERMTHSRLAVALDLKYEKLSAQTMAKARPVLDFFVNLGDLHRSGYITIEEIANTWGRSILIWGALLAPLVERQRVIEGIPDLYDNRSLEEALRDLEVRRGTPPLQLDQAKLAELLDYAIETNTARLRLEQAWKSGAIPSAPHVVPKG